MTRDGAPLRLLMTADAVGGVWTYALDLAEALRPRGVEVVLAVLGPEPDPMQRAAATRAGLELTSLGDTLDWTAHTPQEVEAAGRRLQALAHRLRPELVQVNSPALLAQVRPDAPTLAVCHSDVKTWWRAVKGAAPLPDDLAWRAALTAQGYAAADALAAPSRSFAAATSAVFGRHERVQTVWNGRSAVQASPETATPGGVFAFTAGRLWDEAKGAAVLDRAAERRPLPIYAAGALHGPNGAAVTLRTVRVLGRIDDAALAGWLAARPIFVSPACYEPFGLAVLEAAQAGCPLVLSDIATFRELWDGAAVFTAPGDDAALAAALQALAGDGERRLSLGAAACRRAGRYTVEAMADGMLAVYHGLLGRTGRAVA